jgi:hypothetical protein
MVRFVVNAVFWMALVAAFLPQRQLEDAQRDARAFAEPIVLDAARDTVPREWVSALAETPKRR